MTKLIFPLFLYAAALVAACSAGPAHQPEPVQTSEAALYSLQSFGPTDDFLVIIDDPGYSEPQQLERSLVFCDPAPFSASEEVTSELYFQDVSYEWVDLLARLTMAEAGGECEKGQRLVIDTVLNRVDDPRFPNNIHDVIFQKSQYSPAQNGGINCYRATDEMIRLVYEELSDRTDHEVIFFRTKHYHRYGSPMFQVGCHYFSSYE